MPAIKETVLEKSKRNRQYCRDWRSRNLERERKRCREYSRANRDKIYQQQRLKRIADWQAGNRDKVLAYKKKYNRKYYETHKEEERVRRNTPEHKAKAKKWKAARMSIPSNRIRYILKGIERRCLCSGMPFDSGLLVAIFNPPETCACCRCKLDYSTPKRSRYNRAPSFDRINPRLGYVAGNVAVTCTRCNYAKSDATLAELKMLVAYVEREQENRK